MIEINLIPDVKRELLKAQILRNFIIFVCMLVGGGSIAVVVLISMILGGQTILVETNKSKISSEFSSLESNRDSKEKIITLKNQLNTISGVREASPETSRLLSQIAVAIQTSGENEVNYSSIQYDPATNTITIEGQTKTWTALDAFRKTVADTKIIYRKEHKEEKCEISDGINEKNGCFMTNLVPKGIDDVKVLESSFGDDESGSKVLRFKLSFVVDPVTFRFSTKDFAVKSPTRQDVTDSKTQIPDNLFKADTTKKSEDK